MAEDEGPYWISARDEDGRILNPGLYNPDDCSKCGKKQSALIYEGRAYDYCPACGEEPPDFSKDRPDCVACGEVDGVINHHTSYLFDITVPVCSSCHALIHRDNEKYEHLEPDMGREEATKRGWFKPY